MIKETNCSLDYLKAVTGKFDIENVFILDLREKSISKLNAIVKCKNVVSLNLSRNKIISISGIEALKDLTFLDLSFNNISSMDGIEYLSKLRNLNMAGNKIEFSKNLAKYKSLTSLEKLYFQELNQNEKTANPICSINDYRAEMFKTFSNLKSLDGIRRNCEVLYQSSNKVDTDMFKINYEDFNFNFKESKIYIIINYTILIMLKNYIEVNLNIEEVMNVDYIDKYKANLDKKWNDFQKELDSIKRSLNSK